MYYSCILPASEWTESSTRTTWFDAMQAEIIAIGTELLLGNTLDTNTHFLANLLRRLGVDLYRTSIIGDNSERIAQMVQESLARADIVITTGGLGPTIDDATREGIALALDLDLEFQESLWDQIQSRFKRFGRRPTENNRRQAFIPKGAQALENPVGTAPAFYVQTGNQLIVSLPGVPAELTYLAENELVPLLMSHTQNKYVILTRHIHTAGIGESWLDQTIQDLEHGSNPTVGLSARPGRVDIRITAKAEQESSANQMLDRVQKELERRLGDHIYGMDGETLEATVADLLTSHRSRLQFWISGYEQEKRNLLSEFQGHAAVEIHFLNDSSPDELRSKVEQSINPDQAEIGLILAIEMGAERSHFTISIFHNGQWKERRRSFGGALEYAHEYALNYAVDTLRRLLLDKGKAAAL
jgi:nicotinamide-nucleotide amidase